MRGLKKGFIPFLFACSFLSFMSIAESATFCVSTAEELQTALTTSQTNLEDDVIHIVQGTYNGNFIYASTETNGVTVEGGYTAGCISREVDATNTILDGEENGTVLVLASGDTPADFTVDGLTVQNGYVDDNYGGGLYVTSNGSVIITNNIIKNNIAIDFGSGVYIKGSETVTISDNIIRNNSAQYNEAHAVFTDGFNSVIMTNNIIDNNFGIGVSINNSNMVTVSNNSITNNARRGVYVYNSDSVTMSNNTVDINAGGGIFITDKSKSSSTVNISNNTVNNNSNHGVFIRGYTVTIEKNTIKNNETSEYMGGGGIFVAAANLKINNNTVSNNSIRGTQPCGSGVGIHISGDMYQGIITELTNNTISNNSGSCSNGGGIVIYDSGSVIIKNNVISGNLAEAGGGIYINLGYSDIGSSFTMVNNTVIGNSANSSGGGIYLTFYDNNNRANLYNNIIWNNSSLQGEDIYINNDDNNDYLPATVNLYNNNFDQSALGTFIQIPFIIDASNLDNVDPLFIDPANDDYHLQESSPVIDMGNNNAPSIPDTDKDENPRISGDNVDLGAYEWQNPIVQNNPPSIPDLVYPTNGQTGLPTTLTFEWEQCTDPDGDTVSYKFNYCEDQNFTGCDPIVIASLKNNDTNYAGVGYGAGLLLLGIVTIGSIKGRRKILVLMLIVTGTLLVSCGGGGGGNGGSPPSPPNTNIAHTVSGLNPNTTYYWKVIADDGQDISESAIMSFTTGN